MTKKKEEGTLNESSIDALIKCMEFDLVEHYCLSKADLSTIYENIDFIVDRVCLLFHVPYNDYKRVSGIYRFTTYMYFKNVICVLKDKIKELTGDVEDDDDFKIKKVTLNPINQSQIDAYVKIFFKNQRKPLSDLVFIRKYVLGGDLLEETNREEN